MWSCSVSLVALMLLAGYAQAQTYCWSFNNASNVLDGWTIESGLIWQSSLVKDPDTDPIIGWRTPRSDSSYIWLQDQDSPPNTASILSPIVEINPDDDVAITIYRHPLYDDGSARPVLRFVSRATSSGSYIQDILWSYNYDVWDTVSIRCGPMGEPCCLTYPCTGYFELSGSILARDELLAVDAIGLRIEGSESCDCLPISSTEEPYCGR